MAESFAWSYIKGLSQWRGLFKLNAPESFYHDLICDGKFQSVFPWHATCPSNKCSEGTDVFLWHHQGSKWNKLLWSIDSEWQQIMKERPVDKHPHHIKDSAWFWLIILLPSAQILTSISSISQASVLLREMLRLYSGNRKAFFLSDAGGTK